MLTATKTIYDQLFEQSQAIVEHYRTDFEHDKRLIGENEGVPFIHIAHKCGTYLDVLIEPNSGQQTRYCLSQLRPYIVHYFDGKTLTKIDIKQAAKIVERFIKSTY